MPVGPARMPLFDHLASSACAGAHHRLPCHRRSRVLHGNAYYQPVLASADFSVSAGGYRWFVGGHDRARSVRGVCDSFQDIDLTSVVACSPVILWQILAFFLPALKPSERKWFVPTFAAAVSLFIFGTIFCYLIILDPAFQWLTDQAAGLGEVVPRASTYIDMIIKFELGFGSRSSYRSSCSTSSSSTSSRTRSCAAAGARCTSCSWSSRLWPRRTLRRSPCCSCSRRCWCCTKQLAHRPRRPAKRIKKQNEELDAEEAEERAAELGIKKAKKSK